MVKKSLENKQEKKMEREKAYNDWNRRDATPCGMMKHVECPEFEREDRLEMLSLLPQWCGKRVLELGAGIGRFTGALAKEASHLTTVEWIPQFVSENKRRHSDDKNITYICGDAMQTEFSEGSFDLIFISWLFLYLEDNEVEELLRKIERWLEPGGVFFVRETCALKRVNPSEKNPTYYRTIKEYDKLLSSFVLKKEGSIKAWIDYMAQPFSCYWLVEKPSSLSMRPAISCIPVRESIKTPPLSK
ncbi:MAG: methyltransferase domain-containing protein [Simkania sp.]|nr:methyltransferase domain-containing protein [Simkania sp.]